MGLGTIPQAALARHSGLIRRHFKLATTAAWCAGFRSAIPDGEHKINSYRTSRAGIADTATFVDE